MTQTEMLVNQWRKHCETRVELGKDENHKPLTDGGEATYSLFDSGVRCEVCDWSYTERNLRTR